MPSEPSSFTPPLASPLPALIRLMRPHQWLKNAFVFAGLLFSQTWSDGPLTLRVFYAFAAFCCLPNLGIAALGFRPAGVER